MQTLFDVGRVNPCQDLAGLNFHPFFHQHLHYLARDLGGDGGLAPCRDVDPEALRSTWRAFPLRRWTVAVRTARIVGRFNHQNTAAPRATSNTIPSAARPGAGLRLEVGRCMRSSSSAGRSELIVSDLSANRFIGSRSSPRNVTIRCRGRGMSLIRAVTSGTEVSPSTGVFPTPFASLGAGTARPEFVRSQKVLTRGRAVPAPNDGPTPLLRLRPSCNRYFGGAGYADNTAGNTAAGITDRLATVVNLGMDDHAAADDGILGSGNADVVDRDFVVGFALVIGLQIAEVARVPILRFREGVGMIFRVVVTARARAVGRGTVADTGECGWRVSGQG